MENCPICKTPWTVTQLITSSIKHCKKCNDKAENIIAKYKESKENNGHFLDTIRYVTDSNIWKIGYGYPPERFKKDPNCPVSTKEQSREIRKEIDNIYNKWKESKL